MALPEFSLFDLDKIRYLLSSRLTQDHISTEVISSQEILGEAIDHTVYETGITDTDNLSDSNINRFKRAVIYYSAFLLADVVREKTTETAGEFVESYVSRTFSFEDLQTKKTNLLRQHNTIINRLIKSVGSDKKKISYTLFEIG